MKTVVHGKPTAAHLAEASLFHGIDVTERITARDFPPCQMLSEEAAFAQKQWRMALAGDALICIGENAALVHAAERVGLPIYQA